MTLLSLCKERLIATDQQSIERSTWTVRRRRRHENAQEINPGSRLMKNKLNLFFFTPLLDFCRSSSIDLLMDRDEHQRLGVCVCVDLVESNSAHFARRGVECRSLNKDSNHPTPSMEQLNQR